MHFVSDSHVPQVIHVEFDIFAHAVVCLGKPRKRELNFLWTTRPAEASPSRPVVRGYNGGCRCRDVNAQAMKAKRAKGETDWPRCWRTRASFRKGEPKKSAFRRATRCVETWRQLRSDCWVARAPRSARGGRGACRRAAIENRIISHRRRGSARLSAHWRLRRPCSCRDHALLLMQGEA